MRNRILIKINSTQLQFEYVIFTTVWNQRREIDYKNSI